MFFLIAILLTFVVAICVRLAWGTPAAVVFVLFNVAVVKYAPAGAFVSIAVSGVVAYLVVRMLLGQFGSDETSSDVK